MVLFLVLYALCTADIPKHLNNFMATFADDAAFLFHNLKIHLNMMEEWRRSSHINTNGHHTSP